MEEARLEIELAATQLELMMHPQESQADAIVRDAHSVYPLSEGLL